MDNLNQSSISLVEAERWRLKKYIREPEVYIGKEQFQNPGVKCLDPNIIAFKIYLRRRKLGRIQWNEKELRTAWNIVTWQARVSDAKKGEKNDIKICILIIGNR